MHPHAPCSRLLSELLHNSTSTERFYTRRARSEATVSYSACYRNPPSRYFRALPEKRLDQEGHLHTSRGVADEHELVDPLLDIFPIDEGEREQQEEDEDNDRDEGP
jgi:hypothetical protein